MSTSHRKPPKPWKPGESGNPKGRPPGQSAITRMRASLAGEVPEILATLVSAAKAGDVQAARLILERVLPPVKPIEQPVELRLPDGGTLTAKATAVMAEAALGLLAPGQAGVLISTLGTLSKITETDDLSRRITALEAQKNENA